MKNEEKFEKISKKKIVSSSQQPIENNTTERYCNLIVPSIYTPNKHEFL
ncbi:hypothetical protein AWRI1631_141780 [Saccharomyces cerevisiae AWRI1631]|uniref:Uncharacterized protein n=1 Tax=Saccharomyces cerevisiae (strain AWRI1631) TaxID=545124 RepID=B5VQQ4_YEAS6|nr:hypothetical protein AWRI1631_141780 [Saccharomyces cerevisiae AWRI1631]